MNNNIHPLPEEHTPDHGAAHGHEEHADAVPEELTDANAGHAIKPISEHDETHETDDDHDHDQ